MAVSTNPSLGGHVIQLVPPLSDMENYWGFQGYSPFQEVAQQQQLPANRTYTTNQVPQQTQGSGSRSYDADTSARDTQYVRNTQGRYIPPQQRHPNDHGPSSV